MKNEVTNYNLLEFDLGMNGNGLPVRNFEKAMPKFNFITGMSGNGESELKQITVEDFCLKEIRFDMGGNGAAVY